MRDIDKKNRMKQILCKGQPTAYARSPVGMNMYSRSWKECAAVRLIMSGVVMGIIFLKITGVGFGAWAEFLRGAIGLAPLLL